MSKGKGWDLTSKHSLDGASEWIRKNSDALLVLVIRREDFSFALHPEVAPHDGKDMVESMLQDLALQAATEREAARAEALAKAERRASR